MSRVTRDVMAAVKSLSRQPGFALLVVGTLALGIGANAAIFSVINAALYRPLAVTTSRNECPVPVIRRLIRRRCIPDRCVARGPRPGLRFPRGSFALVA